ncbi:uncharacterized protein C2845_PM13G05320 [Panicum miliaceum]|uniref:Fatty acid desaturase domain-containing protein n=1 Tax=Panicum miliaceum TaxID=4540 RepID=A0A3L6RH19_PANMI|nr:uncharacterized protein C2845_PM13G05320 [Panicum miliaceum]
MSNSHSQQPLEVAEQDGGRAAAVPDGQASLHAGGYQERRPAALLPALAPLVLRLTAPRPRRRRVPPVAGAGGHPGAPVRGAPPRRLAALLGAAGQRAVRRLGDRARVRGRRLLRAPAPQRRAGPAPPLGAPGALLLLEVQPPPPTRAPSTERVYGGEDRPGARLALLAVQLTVGWPMYLAFNTWGRAYPRWASHLDPRAPIFAGRRERAGVALSDAGLLAASLALHRAAAARVYGAPLLVVNAWLVLVTYLHHTHAALPRYGGADWDWLRGALATVDRDYGALGRAFFHNIDDTHHLFPAIPHYHAAEATRAIRPVLGEYYRFDPTPFAEAAWREVKEGIYVEPDEDGRKAGVFWYSNKF